MPEGKKVLNPIDNAIVRIAGDSGDGMQLTGNQFSDTTALAGNDLRTLPDFPAEIRAPVGTLFGVSGFQIQFGGKHVHTPGDSPDMLVAMNPAALKVNLKDLKLNSIIIVNEDTFTSRYLKMAGFDFNPLEDGTLEGFQVFAVPITTLTRKALEDMDLSLKIVIPFSSSPKSIIQSVAPKQPLLDNLGSDDSSCKIVSPETNCLIMFEPLCVENCSVSFSKEFGIKVKIPVRKDCGL